MTQPLGFDYYSENILDHCAAAAKCSFTAECSSSSSKVSHYEWVVLTILTRSMVMYCLSSTLAFPLESTDRRPTDRAATERRLRRAAAATAAPLRAAPHIAAIRQVFHPIRAGFGMVWSKLIKPIVVHRTRIRWMILEPKQLNTELWLSLDLAKNIS